MNSPELEDYGRFYILLLRVAGTIYVFYQSLINDNKSLFIFIGCAAMCRFMSSDLEKGSVQ